MVLQYAISDIQKLQSSSVLERESRKCSVASCWALFPRTFSGYTVRKNVKPHKNICEALHHKKTGQILRRQQQDF